VQLPINGPQSSTVNENKNGGKRVKSQDMLPGSSNQKAGIENSTTLSTQNESAFLDIDTCRKNSKEYL